MTESQAQLQKRILEILEKGPETVEDISHIIYGSVGFATNNIVNVLVIMVENNIIKKQGGYYSLKK